MKQLFVLFLLFLLGCLRAFGDPDYVILGQLEQGGYAQILVRQESAVQGVEAQLLDEHSRILTENRGFFTALGSGRGVWVVFLGLSSTLPAGEYRLRIKGTEKKGPFLLDAVVGVKKRGFLSEAIPLNGPLTRLRDSSDLRKIREARELRELLLSFHPQNQYAFSTMRLPLDNFRQSSFFGDRRKYLYAAGGTARAIHLGVDLAAPLGTEVRAAARGKVVFAADRVITGKSVVIEHLPGIYTLYYHLDSLDVVRGSEVEKGQHLGTVGASGLATGPHLHWEVRVGGVAVDPMLWLKFPLLDKTQWICMLYPKDLKER